MVWVFAVWGLCGVMGWWLLAKDWASTFGKLDITSDNVRWLPLSAVGGLFILIVGTLVWVARFGGGRSNRVLFTIKGKN